MNVLEVLCKNFGWQGGTIYMAIAHFATLPKKEQEICYKYLMDHVQKGLVKDTEAPHLKTIRKLYIASQQFK